MLEFKNVTFHYDKENFSMTKDLSFQVEKGEFVSIIGASGCGKSTLFRLINRLETPDEGEILVNQQPINKQNNYCAYMPQNDLLFPWRTIEKNVCLPMEIQKISMAVQKKQAATILEEVGLLSYKDKFPKELSGGMKQRVSFARTLMTGSDLLMLDEPFSALDSLTRIDMQEWLLHQWEHLNKTILFITHDVEEAIFLSNKIFLITERPICSVKVIEVPKQKRTREFLKQKDMIDLKESLIGSLRQTLEDTI